MEISKDMCIGEEPEKWVKWIEFDAKALKPKLDSSKKCDGI